MIQTQLDEYCLVYTSRSFLFLQDSFLFGDKIRRLRKNSRKWNS